MARPEITGKKKTAAAADRAKIGHNRGPPLEQETPPPPTGAYSIRQFAAAHNISEDLFYKMQRDGWGPATMRVGARTLISVEAAAAWRRKREKAAAEALRPDDSQNV